MIFVSDELRKSLMVIKRIYKDKKAAKLVINSMGDMRYRLCAKNEDGSMYVFMEIPTDDLSYFKIECNPFEMDIFTKFKKEVIELEHKDGFLMQKESKNKIPYTDTDKDATYINENMLELKDKEDFMKILKSADITLKSASDYHNSFLKVNDQLAVTMLPKELHFYKTRQPFPFEQGYLSKEAISFILKSIKGEFQVQMTGNYFVIKTDTFYFMTDINRPVIFPDVRGMQLNGQGYKFKMNPNEFADVLNSYKKEVTRVEMHHENGKMIINPRHPDYPISQIPIILEEGEFGRSIFNAQELRSLIAYYVKEEEKVTKKKKTKKEEQEEDLFSQADWLSEEAGWLEEVDENKDKVTVEMHKKVIRQDKEGIIWRIKDMQKDTWVGGIVEPDFEKMEQYYREGRLRELYKK